MQLFPLPILSSTVLLLLAICVELLYADRLSFMLSMILRRRKFFFFEQKKLQHYCRYFVRAFTYTALSCVALIYLSAAILEWINVRVPTKNFALFFIKALIAYGSVIAIFIAKDLSSKRWLAICLILSNILLSVTLQSNDLVFFFIGIELTNLPFLLLIFRTNITNTPILTLTSHHLLAFIMIVASLALMTPYLQTEHTITFSAYVLSQAPEILYSLSLFLFLLSPIFRSFIPLFHVVARIVMVAPNAVAFTVIAIASSMNILFFVVLHDKLYERMLLQQHTELVFQIVIFCTACITIVLAAYKLLKTQSIHMAMFSAFMIQMSELVFFAVLANNANRHSLMIHFFIVSICALSTCALITTQIHRNGYTVEKFSDLQGLSARYPVLLVCFMIALGYLLTIPLPYYFDLQSIMLFKEALPLVQFPENNLLIIVGHMIFASLMIPQVIVLCRLMVYCFAFPKETGFYQQTDEHSDTFRLVILFSLLGLIVAPIVF